MFLQGLSKEVFKRRTSTGKSRVSFQYDMTLPNFVFPRNFSLIETIYPKISSKSRPKIAKCPLPSPPFDKDIERQE